jgi:hypothetical protein
MHTARLELCKELSLVSGWFDTYFWHATFQNHSSPQDQRGINHYMLVSQQELQELQNHSYIKKLGFIPAYDLGYLLRKLNGKTPVSLKIYDGYTTAYWQDFSETAKLPDKFVHKADTPEDALCMLAIELFKQGVLKSTQGTDLAATDPADSPSVSNPPKPHNNPPQGEPHKEG